MKKITMIIVILIINLFSLSAQALGDISDCIYIVDRMYFYNGDVQDGNYRPKDLTNFDSVSVKVERRIQGQDDDFLIFAFYSKSGKFISLRQVPINTKYAYASPDRIKINFEKNKDLGEIRAFVWSDLDGIKPLSNELTDKNNSAINPDSEKPQYAVIDKLEYDENNNRYILTLHRSNGITSRYFYNEEKTKIIDSNGVRIYDSQEAFLKLKNYIYSDYENREKNELINRVVRFHAYSSTSEMVKIYFLLPSETTDDGISAMKKFDARNQTIGSIKMDNNTIITDFSVYSGGSTFGQISWSQFINDAEYEIYAYDSKIDGLYPFIILTQRNEYHDTRFEVVQSPDTSEEDGDDETVKLLDNIIVSADTHLPVISYDDSIITGDATKYNFQQK